MLKRFRASHWPITVALALGVASVGAMLPVDATAPTAPETLKAWTLKDALDQCETLPEKHIAGCIKATYNTDWK